MMEWIVSSSLLILVVLLLRAVLGKRISAGLRYGLWAVVLARLLVPVSLFSLAIMALPAVEPPEALRQESIYVLPVESRPAEESGVRFAEDGRIEAPDSFGYARLEDEGRTVTRYAEKISPLELLGWIWAAGAAVMAVVLIIANVRFTIRLRRVRRPLEGTSAPVPVYTAMGLPSPCLVGLFCPAVYVPGETAANPATLRHVLAHELTHYSHRDHLWSVLRGVALAVHWWNPLVWLGAYLSRQDCELACDEETLKLLGERERIPYGRTLLDYSVQADMVFGRLQLSTTMSGGKKQLKERLLVIAIQQPRRYAGALAAAFVLALFVSVATFTGRAEGKEAQSAGTGETFLTGEAESPDAAMGEDSGRKTDDNQTMVGAGDDDAERVAFDLKEGESYVLKLGSEALPDSGMYRTQWLELARIRDGREEVVQTLAADEIGVLYTRAWQQNPNQEGSMYGYSSEQENLYAKPLYQIEDAKERNGEIQFDASEGGIILADLNFDGYQDICLQGKTDGANIPYYCFLWNPDEACFEPAYMIPNVQADREAQWIVSATREADGRDSVKYYRFDNDNLLHMVRYTEKNESPGAVFSSLDLTYCETSYSLPAVDEWDLGTVYGGALTERMVTWAKQALTELYEWTGTKLDTAYFSVTSFGDFSFGQNAGDLQASRTFYSRCYGDAAGFESVIRHMVLFTEREVWYSPVTQWKVPEDKDKMTDRQLVEWYFERSALTEGEVADSVQKTDDMDYVIRTESGLYYELTLEASTREVNQVYGPYEEFPVH